MLWLPYNNSLSRNPIAGLALATKTINLQKATKLEIISLIDNTVDFPSGNTRKEVQAIYTLVCDQIATSTRALFYQSRLEKSVNRA